ncbi:MAG: PIN domain-containing protein [Proteobacteria bacterium]|nr:MAG: PIN domain-containing protein [Pseudomonadota bacterium]
MKLVIRCWESRMPTRAHRIAEWDFSPEDRWFFDTNVWMRILTNQGDPNDPNVSAYSTAYKRILKSQATIHTDLLVLAEFSNASLRLEHELAIRFLSAPSTFKTFRDTSDEYGYAVANVARHLQDIQENATCLNCVPPSWGAFMKRFEKGERDFNDELIVEQCQKHDLVLVTHDGDFRGADLRILTHHSAYFARR